MKPQVPCTLCGLPARRSPDPSKEPFCCNGCKMVYAMLMESDQCKDAAGFKDTDLYKQCVAAGVIPDTSGTSSDMASTAITIDGVQGDPDKDPSRAGADGPMDSDNLLVLNFQINNMWCPACAWVLENALVRSRG